MGSIKDFIFGGISGMTASAVVQPIDTIKVRMQVYSEAHAGKSTSTINLMRSVIANEGAMSLYKGLDSSLMRQAIYGTARLGIYKYIYNTIQKEKGQVSFFDKTWASLLGGFLASIIGNPFDVALVRFQADMTLPPQDRRNYKNVFDAIARMVREEKAVSLFRGLSGNVSRAMAMNLGSIACFDQMKEMLNASFGTKDSNQARLIASMGSSVVCAYLSLPFDNVKVKLQKMKIGADGKKPYSGFFDCLKKSITNEKVIGLWSGHRAYALKVIPHAIIVLLLQDYLHLVFGNKKSK